MAHFGLTPVVVLLVATITVSVAQSSTELPQPATNKTLKCPRVGFQFFFKNLNQSVTYRVVEKPENLKIFRDTTVIGYPNATVSFVRTPHSAFLVFSCKRPRGTTCDVFTAWRDFDTGDLRVIQNVLDVKNKRPDLEFTFGVEKQAGVYFWCDPERRHRSRFQLVPVGTDQKEEADSNGTSPCSAFYGNHFSGSAEQCDLRYLQQLLIHNDLKATSGFNKRALLMSIVLMALLGMTLIAIAMAHWMNKRERLVGPK